MAVRKQCTCLIEHRARLTRATPRALHPDQGACCAAADMNNQEIVAQGRDRMNATDAELAVARRVAAQTEDTAVKTAQELKKQTDQMQTVADDLNEIEFTMQRASKVIRDITRGLATDKCAPRATRMWRPWCERACAGTVLPWMNTSVSAAAACVRVAAAQRHVSPALEALVPP
jgi:hypothetical protein